MAYTQAELDYDDLLLGRLMFLFGTLWFGMIAVALIAIGG